MFNKFIIILKVIENILLEGYLQRKAAWQILLKVSSGMYSDLALKKVLANYKFTSLDIAFITELSFGCIRYRKFLDHWVDHTSKLNHKKQPPKLRWLLHIGFCLLYTSPSPRD